MGEWSQDTRDSKKSLDGPVRGVKFDSGKLPWDLLPVRAVEAALRVLDYGARKYAPDNWKMVDGWRGRYFAASMRHLWAWWKGEQRDGESGESHLAHALCCVMFLLEREHEG